MQAGRGDQYEKQEGSGPCLRSGELTFLFNLASYLELDTRHLYKVLSQDILDYMTMYICQAIPSALVFKCEPFMIYPQEVK